MIKLIKYLPIVALSLAACSGGGGGGSNDSVPDTPDPQDQSTTKKKCREMRKAYVERVVGTEVSVSYLMSYMTDDPVQEDFWKNLPDCYKKHIKR